MHKDRVSDLQGTLLKMENGCQFNELFVAHE